MEEVQEDAAQVFNQRIIKAIIFNAVSFQAKSLCEISDLQLNKMAEVNLLALARLLQSLEANKPYFEETLRLIYVSSNSVDTLNASNPFYVACKAGSEILMKNFGKRWEINLQPICTARDACSLTKHALKYEKGSR